VASIVALNADTGDYVWHYQTNPGDTWDYDAVEDIELANVAIDGKPRRVPDAGFEERLLLRHRPRYRQTDLGGQICQGDLGTEGRPQHGSAG